MAADDEPVAPRPRRRNRVRPMATSVREMRARVAREFRTPVESARDLVRELFEAEAADLERPRTRGDCVDGPRPCPWISCRHHLYLNVLPSGSIQFTWPDKEPHELEHSCSLDVADDGGHTLERVGELSNLTRERVRQLVVGGVNQIREDIGVDGGDVADVLRAVEDRPDDEVEEDGER